MCYIRDNDPEPLDLYFSIEEDYFGEVSSQFETFNKFHIIFFISILILSQIVSRESRSVPCPAHSFVKIWS